MQKHALHSVQSVFRGRDFHKKVPKRVWLSKMKKWFKALYHVTFNHLLNPRERTGLEMFQHRCARINVDDLCSFSYHIQCVWMRVYCNYDEVTRMSRITALMILKMLRFPRDLRILIVKMTIDWRIDSEYVRLYILSLLPFTGPRPMDYYRFKNAKCPYCKKTQTIQDKRTDIRPCIFCKRKMCVRDLRWHKCTSEVQFCSGYWYSWEEIQDIN